jgi:molybdopterin/thiamine biosynthesis adenylyltransferase
MAGVQHAAWMLTNLLARQEGVIGELLLAVPAGVAQAGRVVCLADRDLALDQALLAGAAAIGGVPVRALAPDELTPPETIVLAVGPGAAPAVGLRVHGDGWWGGVSRSKIQAAAESQLPLGPYAAACLAAGEVFKQVRLPAAPATDAFYSLWSLAASEVPPDADRQGPEDLSAVELRVLLAGCGAVGSAFLAASWATPALGGSITAADADKYGVDLSNLNRCVIFGKSSIGQPKASEAKTTLFDMPLALTPHDGLAQEAADPSALLASAVDTNRSRQAIQDMYPGRLLSASTLDLRAEILRCDPTDDGACVRCFNKPESDTSDSELRRRFLAAIPEEQQQLAEQFDLSFEQAQRWALDGTCSFATDRLMEHMRDSDAGPEAFAVGFVSAMAGLMLFAQTVREHLGSVLLAAPNVRATLTFFDLLARTGQPRPYARDRNCPACAPGTPAMVVWQSRHEAWNASRERG